jgi:hypothetical protein
VRQTLLRGLQADGVCIQGARPPSATSAPRPTHVSPNRRGTPLVTRAQIDRIARQVDRLASSVKAENVTYVPIYDGESEADALRAYGQPHFGLSPSIGFVQVIGVRSASAAEWIRSIGSVPQMCAVCSL